MLTKNIVLSTTWLWSKASAVFILITQEKDMVGVGFHVQDKVTPLLHYIRITISMVQTRACHGSVETVLFLLL